MGLFLKTLAEHLSAFPNLSEKRRQFHFALLLVKFVAHWPIASNCSPNSFAVACTSPGYPLHQFWKAKDRGTLR